MLLAPFFFLLLSDIEFQYRRGDYAPVWLYPFQESWAVMRHS
jgi:hypothetical protein